MLSEDPADRPAESHSSETDPTTAFRGARPLVVGLLGALALAVEPALAATSDPVCSTQSLPGMIEGFFQLTTGLGVLGLAVVWQGSSLADVFTLSQEQRRALKRHKRQALRSTLVLLLLGPLYTVAGSVMGLPLADCVDLAPW